MAIEWTTALENRLWKLHTQHPGWSTKALSDALDLPWKAVDNALYRLKAARQEHWLDNARVGFLDIETSDLNANIGWMISYGLLTTSDKVYADLITRREIMGTDIEPDRRVVASCLKALNNVDVVVTYNGTNFDLKFLRARALRHGLLFPAYVQLLHIDLYFAAKSLLRLTNKRMGTVTEFLEMAEKDHYSVDRWNRARRGDPKALDDILAHNIADLNVTRDLFISLAPYKKWIRRSI